MFLNVKIFKDKSNTSEYINKKIGMLRNPDYKIENLVSVWKINELTGPSFCKKYRKIKI